jgi:hypothetical protein
MSRGDPPLLRCSPSHRPASASTLHLSSDCAAAFLPHSAARGSARSLLLLSLGARSADLPIVMNTLWRRMADTGKDWRHVYKVRTHLLPASRQVASSVWLCGRKAHHLRVRGVDGGAASACSQ